MAVTNRREFLHRGALGFAAAGVGALAATERQRPLNANPLGLPIGLELYTVREQMKTDPAGTLKAVAAIGYKEVEGNYEQVANPKVRKALQDDGLSFPAAHCQYSDLTSDWDRRVDEARSTGVTYMVCASTPVSARRTLDAWKQVAALYNQAGATCQKAGLQFAYHGHNFEFQTFNGVVAYDELLRETDPKLVQMELDCYWVSRAGKDPVHYFKAYPGRFPILHIKDMKPGHAPSTDTTTGGDAFTEVGRGSIDWKRIFQAAPQAGVKHYFVEQDKCDGPPLESARISYEYLKNLNV